VCLILLQHDRKMYRYRYLLLPSVAVVLLAALAAALPGILRAFLFSPPACQEKWQEQTLGLSSVRGLPMTPMITSERIDALEESFHPRPSDVWVVTYPKSGTTWVQHIVNTLNGYDTSIPGSVNRHCPWPEVAFGISVPIETMNGWPDPPEPNGARCWKSHWPNQDHMSNENGLPGKKIYVMRNSMDVAVSYYYHHLDMGPMLYNGFSGTWEEYFPLFAHGDVDDGSWFEHVASWWSRRNDPDVLLLRYEDLKADAAGGIRRIAQFMGIGVSEERLHQIVNETSFAAMKESQRKDIPHRIFKALGVVKGMTGVRKGIVGDSKSHFSSVQREELLREYNEVLKPIGVPQDWALLDLS